MHSWTTVKPVEIVKTAITGSHNPRMFLFGPVLLQDIGKFLHNFGKNIAQF